ncbi:MAG: hypothetical protein JWP32_1011 [Schumannella sp.]|nr:hypothetical protein [Schumannella sp.]
MMRRVAASAVLAALAVSILVAAAPAQAYWHSEGSGAGTAWTGILSPPTQVVAAPAGADSFAISWTGSAGVPEPEGYYVERIGATGPQPACGSSPLALLTAAGCTDTGLVADDYAYRVVAVYRSWTAPSAGTPPVTIIHSLLGAAASFSVLGTAVTTTGFTRISGDLGVTPGTAVVGFPNGIVSGDLHAGDAAAADARLAMISAYDDLAARPATGEIAGDLNGLTFGPGVYHAGAALALTGVLTLDAGGEGNALFIIHADAAVNTAAASSMVLTHGAQASNVYWVVDAATGTGANSTFLGSILAHGAVTLGADGQLIGRALSLGAVTMANDIVRFTVDLPPAITVTGGAAQVTKDTTPAIAGTTSADPGRTVSVTFDSQSLTSIVQADHTWTVTAAQVAAGIHTVVAKVRDAAGNAASAAQALVVEVNPPTIPLGVAASFSMLAGTTVVATGTSFTDGDVGVSPGTSITGMPPTAVGGTIHAGDITAADALVALMAAIDDASGRPTHTTFSGDMIGHTFHAGVHHTSTAFELSGTMTLDGEGDAAAVFIFQIDAAMTTAASTSVLMVNGAQASNVFWVVDGAVNTGALASLPGTVLATGTVTLGAGTHLTGRALTLAGIVLDGTTISRPPQ